MFKKVSKAYDNHVTEKDDKDLDVSFSFYLIIWLKISGFIVKSFNIVCYFVIGFVYQYIKYPFRSTFEIVFDYKLILIFFFRISYPINNY